VTVIFSSTIHFAGSFSVKKEIVWGGRGRGGYEEGGFELMWK
jgi:hypothetical protein